MSNGLNLYSILAYSSSAFAFIPLGIGIYRRKWLRLELKLILSLIVLSIFTDLIGGYLSLNLGISNLLLLNAYIIIETLVLLFYYYIILNNKLWKWLISIISALLIIYVTFFLNFKNIKTLDSIVLTTESLSVTIMSIIYFHHLLKYQIHKNILQHSPFWLNTAFIFYFVGNMFLHMFSSYLQEHALYTFYELWGLWHSLLNILFYSLISIGFWKIKTSQT